ncbi:hypothetical protein P20652_1020 [Pseudoalteromonas sp. BSi20652]|nr:hypothetical protein P20652_1020 [Pseudoalteromonas sp. BSi20652]
MYLGSPCTVKCFIWASLFSTNQSDTPLVICTKLITTSRKKLTPKISDQFSCCLICRAFSKRGCILKGLLQNANN